MIKQVWADVCGQAVVSRAGAISPGPVPPPFLLHGGADHCTAVRFAFLVACVMPMQSSCPLGFQLVISWVLVYIIFRECGPYFPSVACWGELLPASYCPVLPALIVSFQVGRGSNVPESWASAVPSGHEGLGRA